MSSPGETTTQCFDVDRALESMFANKYKNNFGEKQYQLWRNRPGFFFGAVKIVA
jgi:hypothetical protein